VSSRKVDPASSLLIRSHYCFHLLQSHNFMVTVRNKIQPELKKVRKAVMQRLREGKRRAAKSPKGYAETKRLPKTSSFRRWWWTWENKTTRARGEGCAESTSPRSENVGFIQKSTVNLVSLEHNHENDQFLNFSRFCAKQIHHEVISRISRCQGRFAPQSFSTVSKPCSSIQSSAMNFDM